MQRSESIPGFHGDIHLLKVVDYVIRSVNHFIETGTNMGITLSYVARTYPKITCWSCEPNGTAYSCAHYNLLGFEQVNIFKESSQVFLKRLYKNGKRLFDVPTLFWLDAHGHGFTWPLRNEITFISKHFKSGFIFIDDFKVPHNKKFQFNAYKKQQCSFDFIKSAIDSKFNFNLYYPNYTEHTSPFHPLVGWGLLQFGNMDRLDNVLAEEVRWVAH